MAYSPQKRSAVRAAFEAGESMASISKRLSVGLGTIRKWRDDDAWTVGGAVAVTYDAAFTDDAVSGPEVEPEDDFEVAVAPARAADDDTAAVLAARVAELEAELAAYKPVEVEWPTDAHSAARMLAEDMDDLVQSELESENRSRIKNGYPPVSADVMGAEWRKRVEDRIIRETVDQLTKWASDEGPSPRTLAVLKPDGKTRVKVPLQDNIGNYGLSPDGYMNTLKAKGFKEIVPARCWRENCWLESKAEYEGYCGQLHLSLDPFAFAPQKGSLATTTATFDAASG